MKYLETATTMLVLLIVGLVILMIAYNIVATLDNVLDVLDAL